MHTQRIDLAAATFLPAALLALTDTGAPTWILCVAGVFVVAGACGLVGLTCCMLSSMISRREGR